MTHKINAKSAYGKIGLVLILLFISLLSLRFGSAEMTDAEFFGGLFNRQGYETEGIILLTLRLPRILAAIIAGAGLSVSGVILQSVTGNELASPNIIGVNAGAGFFVILMLFFAPQTVYLRPFAAFAGAFLTTLFILFAASKGHFSKTTLILCGVAITAVLNAGISFLTYLNPDVLMDYNFFSVGGVAGAEINELILPTLAVAFCVTVALVFSKKIDIMCLGDSLANSLGVNVKLLRVACLAVAGLSAASAVSFAGLLGFVGLVVPHIARKITDGSVSEMLKVSVIIGGILVVTADLIGRTLFAPSEIPVGVVMAFVGAPFLLYIVIRRSKNA